MMTNKEIVFNLWYITDALGIIYLLKAKAYVALGTDEQKLEFLNSRAVLDFEVAQDYYIPKRFRIIMEDGKEINGIPQSAIAEKGTELFLFEEVFVDMEEKLSKLCSLSISKSPLISITPLHFTDDFRVEPFDKMKKKKL